jgi:hypothetical protein
MDESTHPPAGPGPTRVSQASDGGVEKHNHEKTNLGADGTSEPVRNACKPTKRGMWRKQVRETQT